MSRIRVLEPNRRDQSPEKKEGEKRLPFRRLPKMNIGLVVFLFIFLYLVYSLIHFATRGEYYSFKVGMPEQLTEATSCQALILREEVITNASYAGYADFYVKEGGRAAVGDAVASVDEIGVYSESVRETMKSSRFTDSDWLRLKGQLKDLSTSYQSMNFQRVREVRDSLSAYYLGTVSGSSLEDLADNAAATEFFHIQEAEKSGLVVYYRDGYEDYTAEELKAADFEGKNYTRSQAQDLVGSGDFLYKTVTSEKWNLVFPVTAEEASLYGASSRVNITFLKNGLSTTAEAEVITGADGGFYVKLSLSRYMVQFVTERFTRIRVGHGGEVGYKLPRSSLVSEEFYQIPRACESDSGFIRIQYEDRAAQPVVEDLSVVFRDEEYCYVSTSELEEGTVLAVPESEERYTVRLKALLTGVYQINRGYTLFCPVEILEESGDYVLVKKNTYRGVSAYDTLLLDGKSYSSGQILE